MKKKRSGSSLKQIFGTAAALVGLTAPSANAVCFGNSRFPKVIQGTEESKNNWASAVTVLNDEALFSGGYLEGKDFKIDSSVSDKYIQVSRINIQTNQWAWHKQFAEETKQCKEVSALAVDPTGTQLAVYGQRDNAQEAWIFVLDTSSGQPLSGTLYLDQGSKQNFHVKSAGLLIRDNMVYMAMDHIGNAGERTDGYEQKLRIAAFDFPNATLSYLKEQSSGYGHSGSLVYGGGSLYIGGSYDASKNNRKWGLAIVRIGSSGINVDSKISILHFMDDDGSSGCSADLGYDDEETAPFINHMGYDSSTGKVFGTTATHNHANNRQGQDVIIFSVVLDANGDASTAAGDFKAARITNLGNESRFFGIHPSLTSDGGFDWIHTIWAKEKDKILYYMKVTVDDGTFASFTAHQLSSDSYTFTTNQAAFTLTTTGTIGSSNSYTGYQAYTAGSQDKYYAYQEGKEENTGKVSMSYFIMASIEDAQNCHRADANNDNILITNEDTDECKSVIVQSITFNDVTLAANTMLTIFETYNMKFNTMFNQEKCNDGNTVVSSVAAGTYTIADGTNTIAAGENTIARQCYGYGPAGSVTFSPNQVTSPTSCSDAFWIYSASVLSYTPANSADDIVFSFNQLDQANPSISWGIKDNSAPGYSPSDSPSRYQGIYTVQVLGTLTDFPFNQQNAFQFELELTPCVAPTIITKPTPTQATYTYNIGENALSVVLDPWTADNSLCTISVSSDPTITPTPSPSIFSFSEDKLTVTVSTSDATSSPGPAGTYTITTVPESACLATEAVSYDIVIVNACLTATFAIDSDQSTFPASTATMAATFTILVDTTINLTWDSALDIVSSTDPCTTIIQEVVEVTADGLTESPIDAAIFTVTGLTESNPNIAISTSDPNNKGIYYLRLKVYYEDFPDNVSHKDFAIEIILPCLSTTLSIDDVVIKPDTAVSLTTYVNYPKVTLSWSDANVQSSIAVGSVCGTYTHEVLDITAGGAGVSLVSTVFPSQDTADATATKFIDVKTTDFTLANQYRLQLRVYFTDYPAGAEAVKPFIVDVIDYCVPTTVTKSTVPADITYLLGRTAEIKSFTAWTTEPTVCNLSYAMTVTSSNPGGGMVTFDDSTLTVSVYGSDVFYNGDHLTGTYTPGSYTVEIRAWADNNYDTNTFFAFSVTITDPCDPDTVGSNISVLPAIVSATPIVYTITATEDVQALVANEGTTVTQSETIIQCPSITFEVTKLNGSATLDSIFTWDSAAQELKTFTNDLAEIATPTRDMRISAYYQGGSQKTYSSSGHLDIQVTLVYPCQNPASLTAPSHITLSDYFYTGSVSPVTYTIAANPFTVDPTQCLPSMTFACSNEGPRDVCNMNEDSGATIGNWDSISQQFTLQTTNMVGVPIGTYIVSIVGTVGSQSATADFTFDLVDPCLTLATLTITQEIFSAPVTHVFRDNQVPFSWDIASLASVTGVSVDGNCGNIDVAFFLVLDDGSETSLDSALFTDDRGPPTQFLINYIDDPTKAGSYNVKFKAFLSSYPAIETHSISSMLVTIVDPCKSPQATITASTLTDQYLVVDTNAVDYAISPFSVYQTWCQVTYSATTGDAALDTTLFTFEPATQAFNFPYTTDLTLAGSPNSFQRSYEITVTAVVDILVATAKFTLFVQNKCISQNWNSITQPLGPFNQIYYTVGGSSASYSFQTISGGGFASTISVCDDDGIYFSADILLESGEIETLSSSSNTIIFKPDGTFSIFTRNSAYLGSHQLRVTAHLSAFPEFTTTSLMVIPLQFERCIFTIDDWLLQNVQLPYNTGTKYAIELPVFNYESNYCPYGWKNFTVTIFDNNDLDVTSENTDIFFIQDEGVFSIGPKENVFPIVLKVEILAELEDNLTNVTSSFEIFYEQMPEPEVPNTAPYLVTGVQDAYLRYRYNKDNSTFIDPVILGKAFDKDGDKIISEFVCSNCDDNAQITYDLQEGIVKIPTDATAMSYLITLTLSDDIEDSQSNKYKFRINIQEELVFEVEAPAERNTTANITWVPPTEEELEGKEEPTFDLKSISLTGLLEVSFSQALIIPHNKTEINQDVFELEVLLSQTNDIEDDKSKVAFTWTVESFGTRTMKIQIEFESPVYISTGSEKDRLRATVRNPDFFQSSETFLSIPMNKTDTLKIGKQMPNTVFTKNFAKFNEGLGDFANSALIGNFLLNLLLSGAMNLLWGLLHAMQIVAHFPLVNIMMPPNAQMLFQIIVKIATFDVLPTEDFIQKGEETLGLKQDSFIISDSFADYEFDSTDPIRNLEVMFLFLCFLITYPLFSVVMRALCKCSDRCKRCMHKLDAIMFWGTYIRFFMEAYLEMQISTLLRFKNFSFSAADQIFQSVFSMLLLAANWGFIIFAGVFLMKKFGALDTPSIKDKFGDLYLGLKQKSRVALFSPVLFMLRRVMYAGICIFWFDRSYFQIQFLIFKQSLFMLFTGQFEPYELPSQNLIELVNETLTLGCTYSLIMFSRFVPDAETRFLCGWELVGLVCIILMINLTVIIYSSGKQSIRRCKLKQIRRKRMKEYRKRQQENARAQMRRQLVSDAMQDQFFNLGGFPPNLQDMIAKQQAQDVELKVNRRPAVDMQPSAEKYELANVGDESAHQLSPIREQPSEESKHYNGQSLGQDYLESIVSETHQDFTTAMMHNGYTNPVYDAESAYIRFNGSPDGKAAAGMNGLLVQDQLSKLQPNGLAGNNQEIKKSTNANRLHQKYVLDLDKFGDFPKYPIP